MHDFHDFLTHLSAVLAEKGQIKHFKFNKCIYII